MSLPPYTLRQKAPPTGPPEPRHAGLTSADIGRLIKEGHFVLATQPIVHLTDRAPDHAEALLRLRPPAGLPALPARLFIDAATAFGLGRALDEAVLAAAATLPGAISVNLCARSLQHRGIVAAVLAAGTAVEITRADTIDDLAAVAATVAALRDAGVRVALDEVDGGAASLACLQAARFDTLKLAGSVVRGAAAGARGRLLLGELLRLAAATGATTIATQIETLPQAWAMQKAGIALGQGWLFGAPSHAILPA